MAEASVPEPRFTIGPPRSLKDPDISPEERDWLERFCRAHEIPAGEVRAARLTDADGHLLAVPLVMDIDRLRTLARANPKLDRISPPEFEPGPHGYPVAATVRIYRTDGGRTVSRTAFLHEHAPEGLQGEDLETWVQDPGRMIAEIAEAMALRTAFPIELGGLYTRWDLCEAARDQELARVRDRRPD